MSLDIRTRVLQSFIDTNVRWRGLINLQGLWRGFDFDFERLDIEKSWISVVAKTRNIF
jgi:hypothetical protein